MKARNLISFTVCIGFALCLPAATSGAETIVAQTKGLPSSSQPQSPQGAPRQLPTTPQQTQPLPAQVTVGQSGDVGRVELRDVLIGRDTQVHEGRLKSCNATSCQLDDRTIERKAIIFIGFGVETATPPPVEDPGQDELHLRGGGVVHETLAQIDENTVFAGARRFQRGDVAWIYLAPPAAEPAPPVVRAPSRPPGSPPGRPPEAPEAPRPPQPLNPSPPPPLPRPNGVTSGQQYEPGALWTGTVHWTARATPTHLVTSTATVRLRETDPSDRSIELIHEGSAVSVMHSTIGEDDCTYAGQGTSPAEGRAGYFERQQHVGRDGKERLDPWTYTLRIMPTREPIWTTTCPDVAWPGTNRTYTQKLGGNAGSSWQAVIGGLGAGVGYDPESDPQAHRILDGGRMIGSYTTPGPYGRSVSWSICRGVACPPPPPLLPDFAPRSEPCAEPANETRDLDLKRDQVAGIGAQLGPLRETYGRLQREAYNWQNDYKQAARDCNLWSAARILANFYVSAAFPAAGETEIGQSFVNFLSFIEKVAGGDTSWVLPDTELGDIASAEDAWEAAKSGWDILRSRNATPAQMRESMLACGAPTTGGVIEGALHYLRVIEDMQSLGERMNRVLNWARQYENELQGAWAKYQEACREYERCRGGDPRRCETYPPSAPSGGPQAGPS